MTVSRWERGATRPRSNVVDRVATATNVSVGWLLTGRETTPGAAAMPAPKFWDEFLDLYEHRQDLSGEDLDAIKAFGARTNTIRSATDWITIAEFVRRAQPSPTFEKKKQNWEDS